MNDEELNQYLRDLVEATVTIAENVESIAKAITRAAEQEYPHDEED